MFKYEYNSKYYKYNWRHKNNTWISNYAFCATSSFIGIPLDSDAGGDGDRDEVPFVIILLRSSFNFSPYFGSISIIFSSNLFLNSSGHFFDHSLKSLI